MSSQPGPQKDLNGSAPDTHSTALLFIDVVSDFNFPGGDNLLAEGLQIAPNLALLRRRAREAGVPVIYVNDNFGRWRSNFQTLLEECLSNDSPSRAFVEQIVPSRDDYVVLKPKNSAFFQTPLDILLKHLGTKRVILCGFCTESCILFSAQDAYMRDLELAVPADCVASQTREERGAALKQLQSVTKANTAISTQVTF